jgi:hypothetical protein
VRVAAFAQVVAEKRRNIVATNWTVFPLEKLTGVGFFRSWILNQS